MRSFLFAVCLGLIIVGALVATRTGVPGHALSPAAAAPNGAGVPADLGQSIRAYLLANPEVLVEAMQELERKQDTQRDAVAQKAIGQHDATLRQKPYMPSAFLTSRMKGLMSFRLQT